MRLMNPKGYAMINAAPQTQIVPANKNQKASSNETKAIQSFFVLAICMNYCLQMYYFLIKKAVSQPRRFNF